MALSFTRGLSGSPWIRARTRNSKYPPAEPEALRLLAPQRGLIAIVERQNHANPISLRHFTVQATRFPALRRQPVSNRAYSRNCQTSTASPAKPGELPVGLELFASRHPEIEIHLYGEHVGNLPSGASTMDVFHQLNRIYNQCFAGLSLSLTNMSLVPREMLAAGCIPVVNEAEQNRMVLDNPFIRYAEAYPQALAHELSSLVLQPDFATLSETAAASAGHQLGRRRRHGGRHLPAGVGGSTSRKNLIWPARRVAVRSRQTTSLHVLSCAENCALFPLWPHGLGRCFFGGTPDVALIRTGAVTHFFDGNER
jgi:hypothetical protein